MDASEFGGKLFGASVKIVFYNLEAEMADDLFAQAYKEGLRLQKIFNFYDKESELSKLNLQRKMKVSRDLWKVLKMAVKYGKLTKGAYDVSLGKQILARKEGKELPRKSYSYKGIKFLRNGKIRLDNPEALIDLGSIAKGYIGNRIAGYLNYRGVEDFFIDARGDMLAFGEHEEKVAIRHPRKEGEAVKTFILKNAAVATSGDYRQFYGDYKKSHILGQKELISVTVVAPTLMEADVFASAVFLLGKKEREELIGKHTEYKVLTVDEKLNVKEYSWPRD